MPRPVKSITFPSSSMVETWRTRSTSRFPDTGAGGAADAMRQAYLRGRGWRSGQGQTTRDAIRARLRQRVAARFPGIQQLTPEKKAQIAAAVARSRALRATLPSRYGPH